MTNNDFTWAVTLFVIWDFIDTLLSNLPPVAESRCNLAELIASRTPEHIRENSRVSMGSKEYFIVT